VRVLGNTCHARGGFGGRGTLLDAELRHLKADLPRCDLLEGDRDRVGGIHFHHRQRAFFQLPGALGRHDHERVFVLDSAQQRLERRLNHLSSPQMGLRWDC